MGKKVLLTTAVPDIEKYWDFDKNEIPLDTLGASSSEKVWTKCPICGNSVKRNVRYTWELGEDGVGHVIHCRTCGKRNDDNSLVNCFPDIRKYWDYEKNENPPEYYAVSSGKKVYVKCPECGESIYRALCDTVPLGRDGKYYLSICRNCLDTPKIKRRFRKGERLAERCPGIKDLWIYEKNSCTPEELTPYSTETIYVKCPICGDELKRSCFNSFQKDGDKLSVKPCHRCGINRGIREKATEKSISLAFPDIYTWWDSDNNTLSPEEISHRSNYPASFICPECQKSFKRPVRDFITVHKDGSYLPVGCPSCGYTPRENPEDNLLKVCPEIAEWWDYEKNYPLLPENVMRGSAQTAFFHCPDCGASLQKLIKSATQYVDGEYKPTRCPYCADIKVQAGINDILTTDPELAKEYSPNNARDIKTVKKSIIRSLKWICPTCNGEYSYPVCDRYVGDDSCPYCANKSTLPGFNDLLTTDPELAKEYSPNNELKVSEVRKDVTYRVHWICPTCNGEYRYSLSKRSLGDNVCPYCTNLRVQEGINDLMTTDPELAKEYSPNNERDIKTVRKSHFFYAKWICPTCNGEYSCPISIRKLGDNACPYCAGKKTLVGFNDLQTTDPELTKEYSPNNRLKVTEIRRSMWYSALWICPTCNGEYSCPISIRKLYDNSCPYCAEKKVLPGMNDLKTRHPELMRRWLYVENSFIGVNPEQKLSTSNDKAWWKCPDCDYSYMLPIAKMVLKEKRGHNPCPRCTGRRWSQIHFI